MNSEFRVLVRPAPESTAICPPGAERRRFRRKTCLLPPKEQKYARKAYKPDFVPAARAGDDHSSDRTVADAAIAANPDLLGQKSPAFDPKIIGARSLFGIAPGGACLAGAVASPAVGSYPTVSPLPLGCSGKPDRRGGFISVALSVGLPRPGVTRHRSFLESGLSSTSLSPRKSDATDVTHACDESGRRSCDASRRSGHPAFRAAPP